MPMLRSHPQLSAIIVADRQRHAIDEAARERELRLGRETRQGGSRWIDGLRRTLRPAATGTA